MPHPNRTLLEPAAWPAGNRAALAVLVDLDSPESLRSVPSPLANEAGADRLLGMIADLDIVPTVIIHPDSDDTFRIQEGIEIDPASHVLRIPADVGAAQRRSTERLGAQPNGIVMLAGLSTTTLENHDFWFMDGTGSPFAQRTDHDRAVIPYTPWWHDATWWSMATPSPPSAMLEAWSISLASVRTRGELMTILMTARLAGLPGLVETIQRFLDEAIGAGDVWITNATAVAKHALSSK